MKVIKDGRVLIINDALKEHYLQDLGYTEADESGKKQDDDVSA